MAKTTNMYNQHIPLLVAPPFFFHCFPHMLKWVGTPGPKALCGTTTGIFFFLIFFFLIFKTKMVQGLTIAHHEQQSTKRKWKGGLSLSYVECIQPRLSHWLVLYLHLLVCWHVPVYILDKAANSILVKPALHHFFNLTCTYLSQKQETRNVVLTQYFQYIC